MNENPILPAQIFFFFPPLLYAKIFPPPTYHLPPPSYLPSTSPLLHTTYLPPPTYHLPTLPPPHSIARAPETLSGSEVGAWSRLGAGASLEWERAWSFELGAAGAGPTQDPGKHFFFCVYFVCLFVELHCTRYAMLQRSSTNNICFFFFVLQEKKKKKKAMASPSSSSFLCNARSYKEEGDGSYAVVAFFFMLWSCSAAPCSGATAASLHAAELLQRGSTLRSSMLAVAVRCSSAAWLYVEELLQRGSTLRSCCRAAAAQLHGAAPCCIRSIKKATATAVAFFFFFVQHKKKRKKKATAATVAFFFLLWRCVAAHLHAMEQRCSSSSTKKATAIAIAFSFFSCAVQEKEEEEGDDSCRCLLLSALELRYNAPPRRRRRQLSSPSSAYFGALELQRTSKLE